MTEEMALESQEQDEDLDLELSTRQVQALDKLEELDAKPHVPGKPYHSDPKVRALQLIAEGRLGGNQRAGREGARRKRLSQIVSDWARDKKESQIKDAYERALESSNERTAMDAANRLMELDTKNAEFELKERESDIDEMDREDLIAALLETLHQGQTQTALEGSIPSTAVEISSVSLPEGTEGISNTASASSNGVHAGDASENGDRGTAQSSKARENPFTETKRRRSSNGRRTPRVVKTKSSS